MTASPMTARGNFSPALYWEGAGANEPIRRAHDGRLGPSLTRARHGSCRSAHPLDLSTETSECMVQRLLFCFLSLYARRIDASTNRHMAASPVSFPHLLPTDCVGEGVWCVEEGACGYRGRGLKRTGEGSPGGL